jgi:entericidin B
MAMPRAEKSEERIAVRLVNPYLPQIRDTPMKNSSIIALAICALTLAGCGNTIRGMGKDTANTVNATQNAGNRVGTAVAH